MDMRLHVRPSVHEESLQSIELYVGVSGVKSSLSSRSALRFLRLAFFAPMGDGF